MMGRRRWQQIWDEGRLGFHQSDTNPDLRAHLGHLLGSGRGRALVPLCGKSRDLTWLAGHFEHVVGVEFVEDACRAFYEEQGLAYARHEHADIVRYEGERVTLIAGDIFAVGPEHVGRVDAVYDRAAMVALPETVRGRYAEKLAELVSPGARGVLVSFAYDQCAVDGPPFSVPDEEVRASLGGAFDLRWLDGGQISGLPPRFEGHAATKSVWLMERLSS